MIFKHRTDDFINFIASFTGSKPKLKDNYVLWNFGTDLSRDIILLGISETLTKNNKFDYQGARFPVTARHMTEKNVASRDMDKSRSPNRSQTSVSPKPNMRDKIPMKKSFTKPM